jgi:hypothetical protein
MRAWLKRDLSGDFGCQIPTTDLLKRLPSLQQWVTRHAKRCRLRLALEEIGHAKRGNQASQVGPFEPHLLTYWRLSAEKIGSYEFSVTQS